MGEVHTYKDYPGRYHSNGNWVPQRAGAGRPKGSINKVTRDIKDMVQEALHRAGGVDYLVAKAESHPVAFMGLVGKVLPLQVVGSGPNGEVQINIQSISWGGVTSEASAPITITSTDYNAAQDEPAPRQVKQDALLIKQTAPVEPLPTGDTRTRVAPTAVLRKNVKA